MKIVDFENGCLEEFYKRVSKNVIRIRKQKQMSRTIQMIPFIPKQLCIKT